MATRPANELSKKFSSMVSSFDSTRKKLELAHQKGELTKSDIERVYDGLFVNIVGSFENFLEEVFFGILAGTRSVSKRIKPRASFESEKTARAIILGKQPFLKWLPYNDNTQAIADLYFPKGEPFSSLDQKEKDIIQEAVYVRNAVAHKSPYALKKFKEKVIGTRALPSREKSPSGYLRGNFRTAPPQTRYENIVFSLVIIANKVAK